MGRGRKAACEEPFTLNWTETIHDTFIATLKTQHDLGKHCDTGFKPEAWGYCVGEVQRVYTGSETIPIENLKNKHYHVYIFNSENVCLFIFIVEKTMEQLDMGRGTIWKEERSCNKIVYCSRYNMEGIHHKETSCEMV